MTNKTTPWNKIKREYLEGVSPKELANKYKTTSNAIRSKACKQNWNIEKETISNNLQQNVQERINELTNIALNTLHEVINDPESDNKDKIACVRAILDISGLKSLKQEVSGINGISVIVNRQAVEVEGLS